MECVAIAMHDSLKKWNTVHGELAQRLSVSVSVSQIHHVS